MTIPSFGFSKGTNAGGTSLDPKFIYPTLDTANNQQVPAQFHTSSTINKPTPTNTNQRFLHPFELKEQVNYKVRVPNFTNLPPLQLGSQYISELNKVDSIAPSDLYYNEINKPDGLDSYFFDYEKGLGEFSRFEKFKQLNLPDKFFDEYNVTQTETKLGMFSQIERVWIKIDNKLVLWNYKIPQSSFNTSSQFLTIDQVKHTILTVKLVRPKPGVFINDVNWLLLVATTQDIHIYIIKYDQLSNNLEIFNPDLSVNTQGLIVNNFAINEKNLDIYFTGLGDGINIWKLNYSQKSSFTKNRCDKVCLTKTGFSSVIPNKLPGMDIFNYEGKSTGNNENLPESISQLIIDSSRDYLYSLSNKSNIRVYKLQPKQEQLTETSKLSPNQIMKQMSNIFIDNANARVLDRFTIIKLEVISPSESAAIQLIAITSYGCRILLKLGASSFGYSFNSFSSASRLVVASIKFPPATEAPIINPELDSFAKSKQHIQQSIANQQKSLLLKGTKITKIISPGVFLCVKSTTKSDKLFVSTLNYGALKKKNKFMEDAEFLPYSTNQNSGAFTYIHDIIQITPSMNASNVPNGYANVLASQYSKELLKFAILTNFGIIIYQYKSSDQILKSLNEETLEYFMDDNGEEETCSSLLYLACSNNYFNSGDMFRRKAQILFATCGNNARLIEKSSAAHTSSLLGNSNSQAGAQDSHPTVDQVVLSDRFYGTCLLVSRLFRNYWDRKVFIPLPHIKFTNMGSVEIASIKNDNLIVQGLNIDKGQVEFLIGSINVLINFFVENGNNILGLNAPNFSADPSQFESEVSLRAEHIAFTAILKSLESMKEALSLLAVLIDETQTNVNGTFKHLTLTNQVNLLTLSFKNLLLPVSNVKYLVKELLSSIINQSILRGGSIDSIASSLQGRCASFCSTDDILIFKALESLTKAKNIGSRDPDLRNKCLKTTVTLFEKAYETLAFENVSNATKIMIDLQFYSGAVDMLLKLAAKVGNRKVLNNQYDNITIQNGNHATDVDVNAKKVQFYGLIFDVLIQVDLEALRITETTNQLKINEFTEVRDTTYETCFSSQDKDFHYHFYQWFIDQGVKERLLEIRTPFVLPFLEEKSHNDLGMSDLLWLNFAKKENYYDAANILYGLALSQFELNLRQRLEYLSRANGFCNCVCPPNVRQKMIQLSMVVQELFEVGNVQLDLLSTIENDIRISKENKVSAITALDNKILTISELFNNYADPLGYYDLCLIIFKTSEYKNTDDILKRWELFFEKLYYDFQEKSSSEPFYLTLSKVFGPLGIKLSSNDLVFPIDELIRLISKYTNQAGKENSNEVPPRGYLVNIFIDSGVSYDKLYYIMKSLIEHNTFEIYEGFTKNIETNEIVYLIKKWHSNDKKLRDYVDDNQIKNFTSYNLDNDPISAYVKHKGIII